ncbi:hypothetical protein GCM10009602_61780 [Nocardiopsis tropica]
MGLRGYCPLGSKCGRTRGPWQVIAPDRHPVPPRQVVSGYDEAGECAPLTHEGRMWQESSFSRFPEPPERGAAETAAKTVPRPAAPLGHIPRHVHPHRANA